MRPTDRRAPHTPRFSIDVALGATTAKDHCALIGLTATPFKGSESETQRLAARYGRTRIDADILGDQPYPALQSLGILANVQHELIEGMDIELTPDELDALRRTRLMPSSVGDRLAADVVRNEAIVESIERLPEDWTVLLFAGSVAHAQTLSALLDLGAPRRPRYPRRQIQGCGDTTSKRSERGIFAC